MRRYTELKNERIDGLEKVLAMQAKQVRRFECVIDLVSQPWTKKLCEPSHGMAASSTCGMSDSQGCKHTFARLHELEYSLASRAHV